MTSAPGTAAEQALLGALLSEPTQHRHLLTVVTFGDMYRPYHGQVFAAMQRLHRRGSPAADAREYAERVRLELAADPDLRREVALDGSALHTLMAAAPAPSHPEAYAAIVVDASLRRGITVWGQRIVQAAGQAAPGMLESASGVATRAQRALAAFGARWEALPPAMRQSLPVPPTQAGGYAEVVRQLQGIRAELATFRESLWSATAEDQTTVLARIATHLAVTATHAATAREREARLTGTGPVPPQGQAAEAAGAQALRDLAVSPQQLRHVAQWLQPGHFANRQLGEIYQVMCELTARDMPCDAVITAWEAIRRGVAMKPEAIARALDGGLPGNALNSARAARQHAARARLTFAGATITAAAADPARPIPDVLDVAGIQLQAVEGEHRALLTATAGPPQPPAPQPAAARAMSRSAGIEPVARH